RRKNLLGGKLAQRLAGHSLHDDAEEHVPCIAIVVLSARIEVEMFLPRGERKDVVDGVSVVESRSGGLVQRPEIADAARVMDEVIDRDTLAVIGKLGDVLPHVVVERDPPLLDEERDRRGRELLRDGAHDEWRLRRDRDAVLDVRQTISFGERDAAILKYTECAAGSVGRVP